MKEHLRRLLLRDNAQSAIEMLSVYAWALLIIAIFVAFIFVISGPKAPVSYLPPVCNIEPLLPCVQSAMTSINTAHNIPIKYTVVFFNNLGISMHLPANAINVTVTNIGYSGTNTYNGTCIPQNVSPGTGVICSVSIPGSVEPSLGSTTEATFRIHYHICKSGTCTGPYVTVGSSTQSMSPAYVPFYDVTLYTNPTNGEIVINGFIYHDAVTVPLSSGTYTLYAVSPTGHAFESWAISAGPSTLSPLTAEPTTLVLHSNASITATFKTAVSTSTIYTSTSTSTTVTSSVTTTIPEFDEPYAVAFSPSGAYAYVANFNNTEVSIVSTSTNTITGTIANT